MNNGGLQGGSVVFPWDPAIINAGMLFAPIHRERRLEERRGARKASVANEPKELELGQDASALIRTVTASIQPPNFTF